MAALHASPYHHLLPTHSLFSVALPSASAAASRHINTHHPLSFPRFATSTRNNNNNNNSNNSFPFKPGKRSSLPQLHGAHNPTLLNLNTHNHFIRFRFRSTKPTSSSDSDSNSNSMPQSVDCIGTGSDVECLVNSSDGDYSLREGFIEGDVEKRSAKTKKTQLDFGLLETFWEWTVLISPFFFWGTAMVAMKEVLPKVGPFSIAAFRLIPAGMLLIGFALSRRRPMPSGFMAWLSISLFALVDASSFQGFLAEGLERTSAGLGSVIIDSQPLTVAVLAAFLFGESVGYLGAAGLVLGVVGLLFLEVPAIEVEGDSFSIWGSGEWWMLLAAQSMAVGTVMVRWVSKYSDPVMATGWHMLIGGVPLLAISVLNKDPAFRGSLNELTGTDLAALFYTSIFGSAISYGVFFYNATRGSLTKLSSLTFLTPMFASIFGYLYLGERFSNMQLLGAFVTIIAIYMVNYSSSTEPTE